MGKRIVIIGAGPTGLGAGHRLKELGYTNFQVLEKERYAGGLSASFKDSKGFIWDLGGHVLHSHFPYFDRVLASNLKNQRYSHIRQSWIWCQKTLIPYPFQNNIHLLPLPVFLNCLWGILKKPKDKNAKNFLGYINDSFGKGIAEYFMIPYNQKIWGYPLSKMSTSWLGEKVSPINTPKIFKNTLTRSKISNWGPNSLFIYPANGTGQLWKNIAKNINKENIIYNCEIEKIDPAKKLIYLKNSIQKYDILISTLPVDQLVKKLTQKPNWLLNKSRNLIHNTVFFVGIGLKKKIRNKMCWVYFPQKEIPFYRITFLSNYSPKIAPPAHSSILTETTSKVPPNPKKVVSGLISAKILDEFDRNKIISIWTKKAEYAYPIPTQNRDASLRKIQKYLESVSIFSRGRFGAFKYEISNMDYSFMQGVEIVDRILLNKKETVWSL